MPVMDIREMRMRVLQPTMRVRMGMRLNTIPIKIMLMPMMRIMLMRM